MALRIQVARQSTVGPQSPVDPQPVVSCQPLVDPQFVLDPQPVIGPPCPAPRVVIPTIPEGCCFFYNVAISTNPALQTDVRDSTGFLNDLMLQINERVQADSLMATTNQLMCENVDEYNNYRF